MQTLCVLFRILLLYLTISTHHAIANNCSAILDKDRIDCYPMPDATQDLCVKRGCCWNAPNNATRSSNGMPWCYYPSGYGYTLDKITNTTDGFKIMISRSPNTPPSPYGGDIAQLQVDVLFKTANTVQFRVTDPQNKRYEVPLEFDESDFKEDFNFNFTPNYDVSFVDNPFGLVIQRKSTGQVIFNSSIGPLIYSEQFIQISSMLPSNITYGLGEHVSPLLLNTDYQLLTLFSRDQGTPAGYEHNLYGSHPIYMNLEPDGNANGVFLLNSNAMEVLLQPTPAITYRTIGGILDFYVFLGPSPNAVVKQYTSIVGRPFMPPYWSLGFHLCRWGYKSLERTKTINDNMRKANIPQDVQWNDIDYMYKHLDFTYDSNSFSGLPDFVDHIHKDYNQRYIMIIDPGISNTQGSGNYPAYDEGIAKQIFVNSSSGKPWSGGVWPGQTNFPDFSNPNTLSYWENQLRLYHDKVDFDGVWIDMNEIATTGSKDPCPQNKWNNPPYQPQIKGNSLSEKTQCMDNLHYSVGNSKMEYDLHSLYGYQEMVATMKGIRNIRKKRGLVISRSTFSGSGVWGGHWLGDNDASWDDMTYSIAGILNFNIFGIPMVGADICGFNGKTTEELCTRWMQLGSFYPFSRNHNTIGAPDQDPASFSQTMQLSTAHALQTRYALLPFLYTLFYQSHVEGTAVARPLFFHFSHDPKTFAIDKQFMWGSELLITPVLTKGATSVTGYFPAGNWYDYDDMAILEVTTGSYKVLDAPLDKINLHISGGSVVLTQPPNGSLTTVTASTQSYMLKVGLDTQRQASGSAYFDDGESLDVVQENKYTLVEYNVNNGLLIASVTIKSNVVVPIGYLEGITVGGVSTQPKTISFNDQPLSTKSWTYDMAHQILTINSLHWHVDAHFKLKWE